MTDFVQEQSDQIAKLSISKVSRSLISLSPSKLLTDLTSVGQIMAQTCID